MVWGIKKDLRHHPLKRPIALKTAGNGRRCGAFRSPVSVRGVTAPAREPGPGSPVRQACPEPEGLLEPARARQPPVRLRAADCLDCTPRAAPSLPTGPTPQKSLFS